MTKGIPSPAIVADWMPEWLTGELSPRARLYTLWGNAEDMVQARLFLLFFAFVLTAHNFRSQFVFSLLTRPFFLIPKWSDAFVGSLFRHSNLRWSLGQHGQKEEPNSSHGSAAFFLFSTARRG